MYSWNESLIKRWKHLLGLLTQQNFLFGCILVFCWRTQQGKLKIFLRAHLRRSQCVEQSTMNTFEKTPRFTWHVSGKLLSVLRALFVISEEHGTHSKTLKTLQLSAPHIWLSQNLCVSICWISRVVLNTEQRRHDNTHFNLSSVVKRYEVKLSFLKCHQCLELLSSAFSCSSNTVNELWTSLVCKAKAEKSQENGISCRTEHP